jgi:hypothetical protein
MFHQVNTLNMCIALSHKSSLVSDYLARLILLVAKDPLRANDVVLPWIRALHELPHIVELELVKLFLHGLNPF